MSLLSRSIIVMTFGLMLMACSPPAVDLTSLEEEVSALKSKFDAERKRTTTLRNELDALTKFQAEGARLLTQFGNDQQSFMTEIDKVKEAFMHHRDDYKASIRARAPGMKLEDFEAMGRQFKNVEVKTVDDWEIAFKHAAGMVRLNLADAPLELRVLFAYNPNVGPKPQPVRPVVPVANEELLASASPGSGGGNATANGDYGANGGAGAGSGGGHYAGNDPFNTAPRAQSVGAALGLSASRAGNDDGNWKRGSGKRRKVFFKDGTVCELLSDW
jgi:hypothetical protein